MTTSIRDRALAARNEKVNSNNNSGQKMPEDFYLNLGLNLVIDGEEKFVSLTGTGVNFIQEMKGDSSFARAHRAIYQSLQERMAGLQDGETTILKLEVQLRKVDHNSVASPVDASEFNISL